MKILTLIISMLSISIITGCQVTPSEDKQKPDYSDENTYLLKKPKDGRKTALKYGLALSGGGTRSASYCIGVLKALEEIGALDKVEVISSVSGGSYASYWYFSKLYEREMLRKRYNKQIKDNIRKLIAESDNIAKAIKKHNKFNKDIQVKLDKLRKVRKEYSLQKQLTSNINITDIIIEQTEALVKLAGNNEKDISSIELNKAIIKYSKEKDQYHKYSPKNKIFFTTRYELNTNIDDPNIYRFQRTLAYSSNILAYHHAPKVWDQITNYFWACVPVFTHVTTLPAYWSVNLVFDWEVNMSPGRLVYQHGLERTYGYFPEDCNLENFTNEKGTLGFEKTRATPIKLTDFSNILNNKKHLTSEKEKWPYFIINCTNGYVQLNNKFGVDSNNSSSPPLNNKVFEFTPWTFGSLLAGYRSTDQLDEWWRYYKMMHMARIVSISGAAVDGQSVPVSLEGKDEEIDHIKSLAMDAVNLDIGYKIPNPCAHLGEFWSRKIFPFPLYCIYDLIRPGVSLKLSDGGQSENLGLYALIRRGCKNIIVIDAEHDPKSHFSALRRLNYHFLNDPDLRVDKYKISLNQISHKDAILNNNDEKNVLIDVYDTPVKAAVITGYVGKGSNNKYIKLLYVKLSIDPSKLKGKITYPFNVVKFANKHSSFPHHSTVDVFYSPSQFRAYRDLAYWTIKQNQKKFNKFMNIAK